MLPLVPIRILHVNLSSREIRVEEINDVELIKKYCGGRGLAAYLYLTRYDLTLDPFDERSPIFYAAGLLTGTSLPCSGRTSILFKSPATNRIFKTNVGTISGLNPGATMNCAPASTASLHLSRVSTVPAPTSISGNPARTFLIAWIPASVRVIEITMRRSIKHQPRYRCCAVRP